MTEANSIEPIEASTEQSRLIRGAAAIGKHFGGSERTTQRLLTAGRIPGFKVGGVWCSFAATLDAWLTELDAEALRNAFKGGRDV